MIETIVAISAVTLVALPIGVLIFKRIPRRVKQTDFEKKWEEVKAMCANKDLWPELIAKADDMLDDILRKKRYSGSSMGERLVQAQKDLSNNDEVWFAHKLKKRLEEETITISQDDVKRSLAAFRTAFKDLGVM